VYFGLLYELVSTSREWPRIYQEALRQVVLAENLGFKVLTVTEHHLTEVGWIPSPFVFAGAIAAVTRKVRIGTNVSLAAFHHPVDLAEQVATLDVLSNGRAILGLGLGSRPIEFDAYGVAVNRRYKLFTERADIIRRLLSEEHVSQEGSDFKLEDVTLTPRPVQKPCLPFWIGADLEAGARRAARYGDAWIVNPTVPPQALKIHFAAYRDELAKLGKDFNSRERPLIRDGFIAKSSDDAWSIVKRNMAQVYRQTYYSWGALKGDDGKYLHAGYELDEFLERTRDRFVVGDPDDVIASVERYQKELGIDSVHMHLQHDGLKSETVEEAMKLMASKVLPYFRS
jgi:alkanesulfonate monooxygenase SsuD/methylene tetrahydromethanopterin reductase-like flavin-dependent oxidoreductase (luciferase family)